MRCGEGSKETDKAACEDCHKNPHVPALGTCTACHVTASFKTLAEGAKVPAGLLSGDLERTSRIVAFASARHLNAGELGTVRRWSGDKQRPKKASVRG